MLLILSTISLAYHLYQNIYQTINILNSKILIKDKYKKQKIQL